jgi:tryptophan synthase alpha chain
VPMTYSSILEAYGYERFETDARAAGATSTIVADLPIEMLPALRRVQLVALTSPAERIRLAAASTDGWLYLVAVMGATGTRDAVSLRLPALVERARSVTTVPLVAGFGISTPEQAAVAARVADGVVVGTRALEVADGAGASGLREFVASLRAAVDDVDSPLEAVT